MCGATEGGLSLDGVNVAKEAVIQGQVVRAGTDGKSQPVGNAYVRLRLALTEEQPTIKPYDENAWAKLPDVGQTPLEVSLTLLDSLHSRWTVLLRSLSESQFKRQFTHPDIGLMTLEKNLALYAWHGAHHIAHITRLRDRMGWNSFR